LRSGRLLIYPTDTLYALGGRALDGGVAVLVRRAKGREEGKPLPLVAADVEQVKGLCRGWPDAASELAARFWPGPLTLVVPAGPGVPDEVTAGAGTVAVRVPALAVARRLCREAGPLISTSANLSGEPPPLTCRAALAALGGAAALALDGGPGRPLASTIVDVSGGPPRLVREGALPWDEVLRVWPGGGG
jgi:L-threonylcarbamoyladenylate synthase